MNGKIGWMNLALSVAILIGVITYVVVHKTEKKVAYVQLAKLFDAFDMSKQYKKKLDDVTMSRKNILDSLELNLSAEAKAIKANGNSSKEKLDQFMFDKEYYVERRKRFEEDNAALQKQYNEEIFKQLNQYIKDYGEKKGYDFVLGADGSGIIMYAKEVLNVTDDATKYINERYKGSSK